MVLQSARQCVTIYNCNAADFAIRRPKHHGGFSNQWNDYETADLPL